MPAEKTGARVTRLLAMMSYLADRDAVPITQLARQFDVSKAQVMKDINLLWVTGLPGYYPDDLVDFSFDEDDDSLVSLREGQGLSRRVPFAPREALALSVALEWLAALGGDAATQATIDSVRAKLRGLVPAEVVETAAIDPERRAVLTSAIDAGAPLRIRYVSATDRVSTRVISPESLTTDGATWYVEAFCHSAGERRTFRVDRMLEVTPGDTAGEGEPPAASDEVVSAVVVLAPQARWIAEEIPDAVVSELPDGALELRLDTAREAWLVRTLLGLGEHVRAVAPAALRESLRARASEALTLYATGYDGP